MGKDRIMMYMGDRGATGFVLNRRRSMARRMIGEVVRALVLVALGGALAWMILCAPEAEAADEETISIFLETGEIKSASICFYPIDTEQEIKELCYYATRENIPIPEWQHKTIVRIWQKPEKVTLGTAINALKVMAGGKQ